MSVMKRLAYAKLVKLSFSATAAFINIKDFDRRRSESRLPTDSVEKLTFASAEMAVPNAARAPFLSGFARLLRCGKDLGRFPEVLGGCGEEEFVICAAWTT
jgi:hypothetical protein